MDRFRRILNRSLSIKRTASPARSIDSSGLTTKSWTTHDSNLALFACLSTATPTRPALPTELILQILEHPSRWAQLDSRSLPPYVDLSQPIIHVRNRPTGIPLLYTRPFSAREAKRLRQVVLAFRSSDQGWSSEPESGGSFSWFEVGLAQVLRTDVEEGGQGQFTRWITRSYEWIGDSVERHGKTLETQPRYKIQSNMFAKKEPKDHTIELTNEHELVQRMQDGDRIVLWACACYPGWENRIYEAKISVWAMDDLTTEGEEDGQ